MGGPDKTKKIRNLQRFCTKCIECPPFIGDPVIGVKRDVLPHLVKELQMCLNDGNRAGLVSFNIKAHQDKLRKGHMSHHVTVSSSMLGAIQPCLGF